MYSTEPFSLLSLRQAEAKTRLADARAPLLPVTTSVVVAIGAVVARAWGASLGALAGVFKAHATVDDCCAVPA